MKFSETPLAGAYVIEPTPIRDSRGAFIRLFCQNEFKGAGLGKDIVQINHSLTKQKGAVRGMHFQYPPRAENKIVRCLRGEVLDVIVDIRHGSNTFLKWHGEVLSGDNLKALFIPEGFAHGFQTLTENVELLYFHTEFYSPEHEGGLRFDDPILSIEWPLPVTELSDRDRKRPLIDRNFAGLETGRTNRMES